MNRVFTKIQLPEKFGDIIPGHLCDKCKLSKQVGYGGEAFGCWEFYYLACTGDEDFPEYSVDPWDGNWIEDRTSEIVTECDAFEEKVYKHLCDGFEGPCENTNATYVRMRTYYQKEEDNWMWLCPECQEVARKYWDEMWEEYYSG